MKPQHPLFSQVALTEDLPQYHLKQGDTATIVEHYPMPESQEDGYSLEGFDGVHLIFADISVQALHSGNK